MSAFTPLAPSDDLVAQAFELRGQGFWDEARQVLDDAIAEGSAWRNHPEIWRLVGLLANDFKQYDLSQRAFVQMLACVDDVTGKRYTPVIPEVWAELSMSHVPVGRYGDAKGMAELALYHANRLGLPPTDPRRLDALITLGGIEARIGKLNRAERRWRQVLAVTNGDGTPLRPHLGYQQALIRLLLGDYAQGWLQYEDRFTMYGARTEQFFRPPPLPRWTPDVGDAQVVVWSEQGAGDFVQMARWFPEVARLSGRPIVVRCLPVMVSLARCWPGVGIVYAAPPMLPAACTHQVPIMSLPLAFGVTSGADIPAAVAPTGLAWRKPLRLPGVKPRIGLCWAGNPDHANDRDRSAPVASLAALGDALPDCTIVVLQPTIPERLAGAVQAGVWERPDLPDYLATVTALRDVDAVITVDTGIAHLAATLGVPTWLIPPSGLDWRWSLRGRGDWYGPHLRVVRRTQVGAWDNAWRTVARNVTTYLDAEDR